MYPVPFPLSPSLWAATASAAPATEKLSENIICDVLVIGGGYAGLSTALHMAERGINVVLLEAREIGFGGSGRNGGQVIPGLKYDPDDLIKMFGQERGKWLVNFAGQTAQSVFDLIDRHQMDVPHVRKGWIQGRIPRMDSSWPDCGLSNGPSTVRTFDSWIVLKHKNCLEQKDIWVAGSMSVPVQCSP